MKGSMKVFAIALGIAVSGGAFANGQNEDWSWRFESPTSKYYKLETEKQRLFLDAGGWHNTYNIKNDIKSQYNTSNCINCVDYEVDVDGDNNAVLGNDVNQKAKDNEQSNNHNEVQVGDDLNYNP